MGKTRFIVVPGHDSHHVALHDRGQCSINTARIGAAIVVAGNQGQSHHLEDAPQLPGCRLLKSRINIFFGGGFFTLTLKSTRDTLAVGTRTEMPSNFPRISGKTSVTARAAPVLVGTMDRAAAEPGADPYGNHPTGVDPWCTECAVVIKPCSTPKCWCSTFTTGARQFVVQEAFETMACFWGS